MEACMLVKDGALVRRARKQRRFSQRELAFLVRRSQSTIYLIETNRLKTITEDLAIAIAARLEVPWEGLFEADGDLSATPVPHASCAESRSA
jgi:putative transcriptional regulator